MLLSLQMGFSFVRAALAFTILETITGLEPSSETTDPRYLKLVTVPSSCPFTFISLWMPLALFVISLVFSALWSYILCRFCIDFLLGLLAPALPQLEHLLAANRRLIIQSTLVISKSKGPSETLRDIRTSTYQMCRIEENTNRTTKFHK